MKKLQQVARYAKVIAVVVWPLGFLLGLVFSIGQDVAGAGQAFFMGLAPALAVSLFFGLVHWFCRSPRPVQMVYRYRRRLLPIVALAIALSVFWYVLPIFEDQQYSLLLKNSSSADLVEVEVLVAGISVQIGSVQAGTQILREGLTKRPTGTVTVISVDNEGNKRIVSKQSSRSAPRRYDGGQLMVEVYSDYDVGAFFLSRAR